jgi:hypothetical protein
MSSSADSLTIDPAARDAFWLVVEDCLVQFHHATRPNASSKTQNLRTKIESSTTPLANELIYHDEPFYVACDIAGLHDIGEQDALLQQNQVAYQSILIAHQW